MSTEDDKVRLRVAEIMSGAGVGYNSISLEVLYLLPMEFVKQYEQLYLRALGPGINAPGDAMAREGELGKAPTDTAKKGQMVGAGSGGQGKRFKKFWVIRDDRALDLKTKMDKRLRGLAREIRLELADEGGTMRDGDGDGDGDGGKKAEVVQCSSCGRIMRPEYRYCPYDGQGRDGRENEGNPQGSTNRFKRGR